MRMKVLSKRRRPDTRYNDDGFMKYILQAKKAKQAIYAWDKRRAPPRRAARTIKNSHSTETRGLKILFADNVKKRRHKIGRPKGLNGGKIGSQYNYQRLVLEPYYARAAEISPWWRLVESQFRLSSYFESDNGVSESLLWYVASLITSWSIGFRSGFS